MEGLEPVRAVSRGREEVKQRIGALRFFQKELNPAVSGRATTRLISEPHGTEDSRTVQRGGGGGAPCGALTAEVSVAKRRALMAQEVRFSGGAL